MNKSLTVFLSQDKTYIIATSSHLNMLPTKCELFQTCRAFCVSELWAHNSDG